METNYIFLTNEQLLIASVLMAVNIGLSLILKLGLTKQWSIASLRMVGQLLLVGFLLDWVFALNNPFWILGVALFMATIASITAVGRTRKRFSTIYLNSFISILGAGFFVMFFALSGVLQIEPWYSPQYLFPLLGMVLGNTLNGISLALERFMDSLGATSWEAAHDLIRDALRTSMIPTLNSMLVIGIVSLPGMMTGQILAGVSPGEAVRYQIMMIFVIASGAALGATLVVILAFRALFNSRHQLLLKHLRTVS